MAILRKAKRTISDYHLLSGGESVLVGLSGGPDSVVLLHILARLRRSLNLRLSAVYINHGIRKRAASREERFCRDLCKQLGVPFETVAEDIPALAKREKKGLEEAARDFRYTLFDRLTREQKLDRIALGHHADDQVETVLFRLARGTGRTGLLGIPHRRGRVIRPLLDVRKDEILKYLEDHRLTFCLDKTNRDSVYRRNYIRNKLLPALRKNLNPAVDQAVVNLADSLEAEELFLEETVAKAARKCLTVTIGGKLELDLGRFTGYDKWLRRRLLRYCLKATCLNSLAPDKNTVERLDLLALSSSGAVSLPGRARAVVTGEKMVIHRLSTAQFEQAMVPGRRLRLEGLRLSLGSRLVPRENVRLVKVPKARKVLLDWAKVRPPLAVRSIRPGDRFRPLGMTGHKKVGDYLTDRKVPKVYRDEIPVVCDRRGIVWLVGFELADRVKVDKKTRKVLTIDYTVQRKEVLPAV